MKRLIALSILLQVSNVCLAQDNRIPVQINNPGKQFKFIGELGKEMGDTLTVRGIIVDGPHKGNEGGPNMIVQMIRDSSIQELIQIPVSPWWGKKFGENSLPKLKNCATYRFLVYETGEYVGRPRSTINKWVQTTGFYFRNELIVMSGEETDSIEWSPVNFPAQNALLSGTAKNENDTAVIQTPKWKLRLIGFRKWTDSEIGKLAEVYGRIKQAETKDTYTVETEWARLIKLEDQLGKTVKLRGIAISMDGYWWFNYRGIDMYVEKMVELVGQNAENHFCPMEITGILEQAELPRIDQITLKRDRDLKVYYIVRKASWAPIAGLLTPEVNIKDDTSE